ncbi:exonuclease domain-containing protein [Kordia algicida OT-1]|uniref:DNA polymerase III, epsilon subunit n=1 Tax=Kordia algicida OT-1 TaxID=391587 RepID=A9E4Q9_9FLAO|nr:exonuclease domain-containing protein [Kordia algicida]EDP95114.1 DNA polymerase III, epsilon subunit [Kordia algicida OT-1]
MYAIVDIETTGGKYNEEGITEIAIYRFDGHEVVDQFISLVNPEREIQPFVVNLTGINSRMLRDAPKFYEVAKRIVEITEDCIIVAHNASFDYRILQLEFKRLGFEYKRKSLCTVELSKKLIPEMESYKLGKLVRALGIPMSDRHRASGDALATVKLFQLLLDKDSEKNIIQQAVKTEIKKKVATRLLDILENLPSATGVYYMHNAKGEIIYIGKSKNIKKRVNQHFTGKNNKSKKIQKQVAAVTFERTGSELVALLKESEEIKRKRPIYNRAQRKNIFQFAMGSYVDENGYIGLRIEKADGRKKHITTFTNMSQAKHVMFKLTEDFKLCQKINELHSSKSQCFQYTIKECDGACINQEDVTSYNKRVQEAIDRYSYANKNMLIIDKGRHHDERSAILIENGQYKGFGFYSLNYQITKREVLEKIITPMQNNRDVQHIIQSHLRRKNRFKIIHLQ